MRLLIKLTLVAILAAVSQQPAVAQPHSTPQTKWIKTHRVVIQVDQDDREVDEPGAQQCREHEEVL